MNAPERTSTTSTNRRGSSRPCARSTTFGMSAGGRLSITKNPRSSNTSAALDRPAPDIPVMIVTSSPGGVMATMVARTRTGSRRVQLRVHRAGDVLREPRDGDQLLLRLRAQLLHGAELAQQARTANRPQSLHLVEDGRRALPVAQLAVIRDGKAMRFVAHLLQQIERLGVARDAHRLRKTGPVHLLEPLGETGDADVLEAQLLEDADRHAELALAAVDEQEVRRVREPLARARPFVALVEVTAEPPGEHLFHRREVVLTVLVSDLEAPVVGPLREPVLHHDHRADDLGALEVRDVEALDAQRRLRQVERVLQRRERASAGVVVRRTLELVLGERFVRVVRDGLEELTLVAALRHAHSHLGAPQQSEELLVELEVLGRPRHEHLARNVVASGVAVELFEELAHELGRVDVLHLVDDETLAADDATAPHG